MADDLENLARRLPEFIEAVRRQAFGVGGVEVQVGLPLQKQTLEQIYEKCLADLTGHEHDALGRMIEKMRHAPPSPPGAIVSAIIGRRSQG